jgi:hypothetical protein
MSLHHTILLIQKISVLWAKPVSNINSSNRMNKKQLFPTVCPAAIFILRINCKPKEIFYYLNYFLHLLSFIIGIGRELCYNLFQKSSPINGSFGHLQLYSA